MKKLISLLCLAVFTSTAFAAVNNSRTLYFTVDDNVQLEDEVRFAVLLSGGKVDDAWRDLAYSEETGQYSFQVADNEGYSNAVFCIMSSSRLDNVWENRIAQTPKMPMYNSKDLFAITYVSGYNAYGEWRTFASSDFSVAIKSQTPFYVGDEVLMQIEGKQQNYRWFYSTDKSTWVEIFGVSDSYSYQVLEERYFKVVSENGKYDVLKITPSKKTENMRVVYEETFGELSEMDARGHLYDLSAKSMSLYASYEEVSNACTPMKYPSKYALLANPRSAGCYEREEWEEECNCAVAGNEKWYRDIVDHTEGDTYGGMLMLYPGSCRGNSSGDDVMLEISSYTAAANSNLELSFYLAAANVENEHNMPIDIDIVLFSRDIKNSGIELDRVSINHILLDDGWKKISAVLNTKDSYDVGIKIVNKSEKDEKNAILLDDIEIRASVNELKLTHDSGDGVLDVLKGDTINFYTSSEGLLSNNIYLWQYSEDNVNWYTLQGPCLDVKSYKAKVDYYDKAYFRVVVAHNEGDITSVMNNEETRASSECIFSNTIEVNYHELRISSSLTEDVICMNNSTQLVVELENPTNIEAKNLSVTIYTYANYTYNASVIDSDDKFEGNVWKISSIGPNETKKLVLDVKTNNKSYPANITSYLSSLGNKRWQESYYTNVSSEVNLQVNHSEDTWAIGDLWICASETPQSVDLLSYHGTEYDIKYYLDSDLQTEINAVDIQTPSVNKYYGVIKGSNGCVSDPVEFTVTIKELPIIKKFEVRDPVLCNSGQRDVSATIDFEIEGGKYPYAIYYEYMGVNGNYLQQRNLSSEAVGSFTTYPYESGEYRIVSVDEGSGCTSTKTLEPTKVYVPNKIGTYISESTPTRESGEDFSVTVTDYSGYLDTYQWQVSYDNGETWADLSDNTSVEPGQQDIIVGSKTSTLSVSNLSGDYKKIWYRAVLSKEGDECSTTISDVSILQVKKNEDLVISSNVSTYNGNSYCVDDVGSVMFVIENRSGRELNDLVFNLTYSNQENIVITPSVGDYHEATKEWTISSMSAWSYESIVFEFKATNSGNVRLVLASNEITSTAEDVKLIVKNKPIIGELKAPKTLCAGGAIEVEIPDVVNNGRNEHAEWLIDGQSQNLFNYFQPEEINGSALVYRVENECGSSLSNEVKISFYSEPVVEYFDVQPICEGESLNLIDLVDANSGQVLDGKWILDGEEYTMGSPVPYSKNGKELYYRVDAECYSNLVNFTTITVKAFSEFSSDIKELDPICPGFGVYLSDPNYIQKGADYVASRWILDGEQYDMYNQIPLEKNGAKLYFELEESCGSTTNVIRSNEVEVKMITPAKILNVPSEYYLCEGQALELPEPEIEYSVEPNDVLHYDQHWSITNSAGRVEIENYDNQTFIYIDSNREESYKAVYTVVPYISDMSGNFNQCEATSTEPADIILRKKPQFMEYHNLDKVPYCEGQELPCKPYAIGIDDEGNERKIDYYTWNNEESGKREFKTYLGGELVPDDYIVKYPGDNGKQYYYSLENECGVTTSQVGTLQLIKSPQFKAYTFPSVCAGDALTIPDKSEFIETDSECAYVVSWYINGPDYTENDHQYYPYPYPNGQLYGGEPIDESYDGMTIYYATTSECGNQIFSTPTKISLSKVTAMPTVEEKPYCPVNDDVDTPEREDLIDLSELVLSDKTELKFYATETSLEPLVDTKVSLSNTEDNVLTYTYWVTNTLAGECESPRAKVLLIVDTWAKAYAGEDIKQCDESEFVMAADPVLSSEETGEWTVVSVLPEGAEVVIENPSVNNTKVNLPVGATATLRWTVQKRDCAPVYDEVILTNFARPVIAATFKDNTESSLDQEKLQFTCRTLRIFAQLSGAEKYIWEDGNESAQRELYNKGKYVVRGSAEEMECLSEAVEIEVGEDKTAPSIKLSMDTTYITCRNLDVEIASEITNENAEHTYSYEWNVKGETSKDLIVTKAGTYTLKVIDNVTFCSAEKSIEVKDNLQIPLIDIQELPKKCLPFTVNLNDAIGEKTIADKILFFKDEALTLQVEEPIFEASLDTIFYAQGIEVSNNGCLGKPYKIVLHVKETTAVPEVEDYDECAVKEYRNLSSQVKTTYDDLKFYAESEGGEPIADLFDASLSDTTVSYWVTNTEQGECESERAEIKVHIEGNVDFDMNVSETRVLAGSIVDLDVTGNSTSPINSYVWYVNDEVVLTTEDEETYSDMVYLDRVFKVDANGRCNTATKEITVEAIWPTAITPYNENGKNDIFAPGMHVMIFDRHYQQVFEGDNGWDGTANMGWGNKNEKVIPDTYYYCVILPSGEKKVGSIEIVRM